MCTSFVVNRKKTIVGWNLDILDMEYRVRVAKDGVFIEINDEKEGWLPLFGANSRGDFVGMPTCHPFDARSNPPEPGDSDCPANFSETNADGAVNSIRQANSYETDSPSEPGMNVIMLDIDLLLQKKTVQEIREFAEHHPIYSVPGVTFMSALSDQNGNVLYLIPGQGYQYFERPEYKILTNFSPFKQDREKHPWMGWDRYHKAEAVMKEVLEDPAADFEVKDGFHALREASQEACPTVVSMIYDVSERTVYWCENREWDRIEKAVLI